MTGEISDAHAHMGTEAELAQRIREQIPTLLCASTPTEAKRLEQILEYPGAASVLIPTFGLHPWHAGEYPVEEMAEYFTRCHVIGEIGMDSEWCEVPLAVQRAAFEQQLALASRQKKPVILHTKGQEKEIAELIGAYPNTYLVHWYSSMENLERYLALGCYFSIGPDVWWNCAVRQAALCAPADRLLVETDGMGAVRWAYKEAPENVPGRSRPVPASVREALTAVILETAAVRGMDAERLKGLVWENFKRFYRPSCRASHT